MKMSDSMANLFSAVSKMQSELTNASKNKKGHNYKYADLAECLETAKEPLANNGLCVIQQMGMTATGENTLFTTLAHTSGEFMQSETIIPKANLSGSAKGNPVQEMGASITYMRRYCFAAIIGMTQEDTDGASPPPDNKKTPQQQKPQETPTPDVTEQREKLVAFLTKECGSIENALSYCTTALGKQINNFNALGVQEIGAIRVYYNKNKSA